MVMKEVMGNALIVEVLLEEVSEEVSEEVKWEEQVNDAYLDV